ncbi:MAG: hypothetical protein JXA87_05320 [Thermoleophilia bacterium]|nr:hypothetical protein [Thermoleophilia bacterium]
MADYLPLCAFRQGLLPADCRSCAWWQTTGGSRLTPEEAAEKRRRWMADLEKSWGSTGLLLQGNVLPGGGPPTDAGHQGGAPSPAIAAAVNYAPPAAVPRLRELTFGALPPESAFLFCLKVEEGYTRFLPRRVLHKALAQLRGRGIEEVFAVAGVGSRAEGTTGVGSWAAGAAPAGADDECRFFSVEFLAANGFEQVTMNGDLVLMRADVRGLLSLVGQVGTAMRRTLHNALSPSPAMWSRRGG